MIDWPEKAIQDHEAMQRENEFFAAHMDRDASHFLAAEIRKFERSLEPLGESFQTILYENLWDLYVRP